MACWPAAAPAAFDPTDVVQIQATVGLSHDDNLFRLPDLDPRLFGIDPNNKADTALIKGVGLKFDKLVSRQRLIADLNLNETTYDKNTNLDFFGGDGRLAWMWQVGNYWSGEASFRKRRTLGGFADELVKVQDLVDTDTTILTGGYQLHPRWRIAAEFSDQDSTHSAPSRRSLDTNGKATGFSLTHSTPADNSIALQGRRTHRSYPNRLTVGVVTFDNNHIENRLNLTGVWRTSGLLRLDGQVGRVDVSHEQLSVRDFSGGTWRAGATWDPTGKLRLSVNGSKDIRLYEDLASSYIVVNAFGITPTYAITPKLVVQGDLSHETREFRGDPGFVIGLQSREDKVRIARLALSYAPLRNVDFSISYEAGDRKSNQPLNNFEYQSWFGTVRVNF